MKQTIEIDVRADEGELFQVEWASGLVTWLSAESLKERGIEPPERTYTVTVELTESEVRAMRGVGSNDQEEFKAHTLERITAQQKLHDACCETELPR